MNTSKLPIPSFFNSQKVDEIWRVDYERRAVEAKAWAQKYELQPAAKDTCRVSLILVDIQNTFCIPGFELYVRGRSGIGAVEDNRRLCEFIYRNLDKITEITLTLDTHQAMQIFHPIFLVNESGGHPTAFTQITSDDIMKGKWRFNPTIASSLQINPEVGQKHLEHYVEQLAKSSKYDLTIWPYHAMFGSIARISQPDFSIKGFNPLTEHYSAIGPEIQENFKGEELAKKDKRFIKKLKSFDAMIIAGQAKSHCLTSTIRDLLSDISAEDESLTRKVYLLEDCTSPVVIPGVIDYTEIRRCRNEFGSIN
jgi:nicotinamidase-related amidase